MTIYYSIRFDCTKKAVVLQTVLQEMAGVQRVTIKKGTVKIIYDSGVTDARHIREKIMQEGFKPTNEMQGAIFERIGAILAVYQRERPVYL